MTWTPLLQGTLAERALETVEAIGVALEQPQTLVELDAEAGGPGASKAVDLAGGRAGMAVFFSYLAQTCSSAHAQTANDLLDAAISAVEATAMSPSLYAGFPGIAWTCTHLGAHADEDDPNAEIDEALIHHLRQTPWTTDYDLIDGLVGLGVYALEQRPHPRAAVLLTLVLERLAEIAQPIGERVTWHTPPDLLSDEQRLRCPVGHYNLGVAHGVPGVIALLGLACQSGHHLKAGPLLDGAVKWLLDQRLDCAGPSVFPTWVLPGTPAEPSRLAWCYGDAGMAAALLVAARGAERPDWEREALAIAKHAAERPMETTRVLDAGLCHGAAGLAHIFNRLYQATGETWLADAAQHWCARTLDLRRPGEGVAGFLALELDTDRNEHWRHQPGLLTGAAGIGLALLAACSSIEPEWDRTLLLSIPGDAQPHASPR